jgi:hypothetical protein
VLGNGLGLSADIGGRIPHLWVARGERPVSTLDLLGPGLTLFAGPEWAGPAEPDGADSPPVTVERLDAITARGLGLTTEGYLLARPDGHPILLSNPADGVDHSPSPIGAPARARGHRAWPFSDRTSRRVMAKASGSP